MDKKGKSQANSGRNYQLTWVSYGKHECEKQKVKGAMAQGYLSTPVEEEGPSDQLDPPARGRHRRGLGGHARGLVLRHEETSHDGTNKVGCTLSTHPGVSKNDPFGPVPANPPGTN